MGYDFYIADENFGITFNYAWFFYKFIDEDEGIKILHGLTCKQALVYLKKIEKELLSPGMGNGEGKIINYWDPTPANVYQLAIKPLIEICEKYPRNKITVHY